MRKFLPHISILLIILAGIGFLKPVVKAYAAGDKPGTCTTYGGIPTPPDYVLPIISTEVNVKEGDCLTGVWVANDSPIVTNTSSSGPSGKTAFEYEISRNECSMTPFSGGTFWPGCFIQGFYGLFYVIPAFLLAVTAYVFNVMISVTLTGDLLRDSFVASAWSIVRDLSNIFFILILLYIAVRLILGLAGHGVKEMIGKVIIIALLINFSMFFTGIAIDAGNMVALVFYNKLEVKTTVNGKDREYASVGGEKDVAGGMVAKFDPTRPLTPDFFERAREVYIHGEFSHKEDQVPAATLIGLTIVSGLIMGYAIYALFISAIAFVGRLIELWLLIIASPFAFMSSVVPEMSHIRDWGWENWLHRLLTASFMAPAFMFFLYFIFLLINSNIFSKMAQPGSLKDQDPAGFMKMTLGVLLPAALILILLKKSVKIAEAGAGEVGGALISGGKKIAGLAGGLVVGGGIGLAASGLQGSVGHVGKMVSDSKWVQDLATSDRKGVTGWAVRRFGSGIKTVSSGAASSSFDLRQGVLGGAVGALSTITGIKGHSKFMLKEAGGYEADLKRREEKRKKRAESYEVKENEKEKQELNRVQEEKQMVAMKNEKALHHVDEEIKGAEDKAKVAKDVANSASKDDPDYENKQKAWREAAEEVKTLKQKRKDIKKGGYDEKSGEYRTHNGYITKDEYEKAQKAVAAEEDVAKAAQTARAAALAEKEAAEATLKLAQTAVSTARKNPDNREAIAAAEKAETEAKKKLVAETNNADQQLRIITAAPNKILEAKKREERANEAKRKMDAEGGTFGNSQNHYEDHAIPDAEAKLKQVNNQRRLGYANDIQTAIMWPWNRASRRKSAHEIRMGVKPEKEHGSDHSHGVGLGDIVGELAAEIVAEKVVEGGDKEDSGGHPPAAEHHG